MIARSLPLKQQPLWQLELKRAITDPAELLALLELDPALLPAARNAAAAFRLRVPRGFLRRIRSGDVNDPVLRQVLPLAAEQERVSGYSADPVGDMQAMAHPGLLRKYQGRALLITSAACAVHCRYCFRRHFPYGEANASDRQFADSLAHIAADTSINEVILSGGDPLMLPDDRLSALTHQIEAIAHVRRLRIHTRLPVVLPQRVDTELLRWLGKGRLQKVMVLHVNHAAEFGPELRASARALRESGVTLLNQSVLLAGVNDSADALAALSEVLFEAGILPYYLHQLDRVQGAAHFEVPRERAQSLLEDLRKALPGYLVPRLVEEVPGAPYKRPL